MLPCRGPLGSVVDPTHVCAGAAIPCCPLATAMEPVAEHSSNMDHAAPAELYYDAIQHLDMLLPQPCCCHEPCCHPAAVLQAPHLPTLRSHHACMSRSTVRSVAGNMRSTWRSLMLPSAARYCTRRVQVMLTPGCLWQSVRPSSSSSLNSWTNCSGRKQQQQQRHVGCLQDLPYIMHADA
jgi:hypothetical protein